MKLTHSLLPCHPKSSSCQHVYVFRFLFLEQLVLISGKSLTIFKQAFLPSLFLFQSFACQGLKVSYLHHNWNAAAALPDIHPSTGMSSNSRMDLLTGCFEGDFDCPCSWTCSVLTAHIPPMSLRHHDSLNWAPFLCSNLLPCTFCNSGTVHGGVRRHHSI